MSLTCHNTLNCIWTMCQAGGSDEDSPLQTSLLHYMGGTNGADLQEYNRSYGASK